MTYLFVGGPKHGNVEEHASPPETYLMTGTPARISIYKGSTVSIGGIVLGVRSLAGMPLDTVKLADAIVKACSISEAK